MSHAYAKGGLEVKTRPSILVCLWSDADRAAGRLVVGICAAGGSCASKASWRDDPSSTRGRVRDSCRWCHGVFLFGICVAGNGGGPRAGSGGGPLGGLLSGVRNQRSTRSTNTSAPYKTPAQIAPAKPAPNILSAGDRSWRAVKKANIVIMGPVTISRLAVATRRARPQCSSTGFPDTLAGSHMRSSRKPHSSRTRQAFGGARSRRWK